MSNQVKAVAFYISNFLILTYIFTVTSIPDIDNCHASKREMLRERCDRRQKENVKKIR